MPKTLRPLATSLLLALSLGLALSACGKPPNDAVVVDGLVVVLPEPSKAYKEPIGGR